MKKLSFILALLPALLFAQNDCESSFIFGCFSTLEYNPVCGCDEVTYPNPSAAACNSITEYTMGTCVGAFPGCMDDLAINYNPLATEDDGTCIYVDIVLGCMDTSACNYNPEANLQYFSCEFAQELYDCEGNCLSDSDIDGVCDGIDNCILISNFDQLDSDSDGEGNVCDYDDNLGIEKIKMNTSPPIKMIDVLGREFKTHPTGKILFYIYQDSSVEKKFIN